MNRPILVTAGVLAALATCSSSLAQITIGPGEVTDVLIRINGPVHVGPRDTVATVWVINHEALIEGLVTEQLIVVNGTARVSGTVARNVIMVGGTLELMKGARVGEDVGLFRSVMIRDPGTTVTGQVVERRGFSFSGRFLMWLWLGMTTAILAAGLVYAGIARPQLTEAGEMLTRQPGNTALATIVAWMGLPFLAFLSVVSVIGMPLGFGIMVVLLPALWFLGYLVVAERVGLAVAHMGDASPGAFLSMTAGVLLLQTLGFVPVFGGLVVLFSGIVGGGALLLRLWNRLHGKVAPHPVPLAVGM